MKKLEIGLKGPNSKYRKCRGTKYFILCNHFASATIEILTFVIVKLLEENTMRAKATQHVKRGFICRLRKGRMLFGLRKGGIC
jgi:hypothetical protein